MATAFSKALAEFDSRVGQFNRDASRASEEMHERVCKSLLLCSESRELIAKLDGILDRGRRIWRHK